MSHEFYDAVKKVYDMSKSDTLRVVLMAVMTGPDVHCHDCGGKMIDKGQARWEHLEARKDRYYGYARRIADLPSFMYGGEDAVL